jgi:hypothetical protein
MGETPDSAVAALERKILAFLHNAPNSEDTLAGIMQWWLPQQNLYEAESEVKQALTRLVERGLISVRVGVNQQLRYRLGGRP